MAHDQHKKLPASFFWAAMGPYRRRACLVMFLVLVDTGLASLGIGMVLPVFQALLDPEHKGGVLVTVMPFLAGMEPRARLALLAGVTVVLFAAKAGISLLTTIVSNDFLQKLRFHWVARIGENYLYGPYRRMAGKKQGKLLNDWFNETLSATRYYQSSLAFFSSSMLALALLVLGLFVNWQVMLIMLAAGFLLVMAARRYLFGSSTRLSKLKVRLNQAVSTNMVEDLAHARDLKLMQAEARRLDQLASACEELKSAVLRGALFADIPRVAGEFLAVLALMSFVVAGVVIMDRPAANMLPMLAFFFVAFYRLVSASSIAMTSHVRALNELNSVEVVHRLVSESTDKEEKGVGLPLKRLETDIIFNDLGFSYDKSHTVLSGIRAVIPRGKTTFLLGPSGSGKSTLLDLLLRLERPDCGGVELNGYAAKEYSLSDWRRLFGYVSQEAALFNGDIRVNLALAKPTVTDEEMVAACRLAGADEFIRALPDGYATVVGDRGYSLSGGQRKRVAIARALIGNPDVLILDEATSSFEQSLEQEMLRSLRLAMPDLTLVQVTHRLQAAEQADWIIALENGRIVAEGDWPSVRTAIAPLFAKPHQKELAV